MKRELDEALCRDFPLLYRDRFTDMRSTAMCWGFPGSGWEPLLRRLSEKLESMIRALETPEGWPCACVPCASQVKEKFGTLRFYMTSSTDEMEAAIDEAEAESARTCEDCGNPGSLREGDWLRTLCNSCSKDAIAT